MIDQIINRIKASGVKKSHVAKMVGISSSQLSQYLNGKRKMPTETEFKLRKVLSL